MAIRPGDAGPDVSGAGGRAAWRRRLPRRLPLHRVASIQAGAGLGAHGSSVGWATERSSGAETQGRFCGGCHRHSAECHQSGAGNSRRSFKAQNCAGSRSRTAREQEAPAPPRRGALRAGDPGDQRADCEDCHQLESLCRRLRGGSFVSDVAGPLWTLGAWPEEVDLRDQHRAGDYWLLFHRVGPGECCGVLLGGQQQQQLIEYGTASGRLLHPGRRGAGAVLGDVGRQFTVNNPRLSDPGPGF
mmetsp:Transcript_15489/g.26242  ORF Transcript_15489/g.26242 Transcript_15489/m.26242 type:complete len:244 (+) Transcript_15489:112-843(+)